MPRPPLRIRLDDTQRAELGRWLRQPTLAPRVRRRLEALRLADQGHTAPQIAPVLGIGEHTVRRALRRFTTGGLDALADRPRCGRPPKLSGPDLAAVCDLLDQAARQGEAWTAAQLAGWLAATREVTISPGRLGAWLRRRGCRWSWSPTSTPPPG